MLGKISSANGLWALMSATKAQGKAGAAQATDDPSAIPESVRRSREALNTLKQANASRGSDRKAAAKAKVDRLKAELQNLRLMSGGNPKAAARRAAQIARELGAAAKEYASAGGSAGLGLPASSDGAATGNAADAGTPASTDAAGQTQAEAAATQASAEAGAQEAEAADTGQPAAGNEVAESFRQSAAQAQKQGAENKEDADFAAEVRRAHAQAKALVREQARRAAEQNGDDPEMARLSGQVDEAGAEIEGAFSDAAAAVIAVPVAISV